MNQLKNWYLRFGRAQKLKSALARTQDPITNENSNIQIAFIMKDHCRIKIQKSDLNHEMIGDASLKSVRSKQINWKPKIRW